ncbi:hypothetical protein [Streptomyces xanthochromogenes]|uniref:hypothetical protein n=1 Tax=Streptomyces xanthochromogenes TaxID=67384 RepID=UPI001678037D|nr:hypothetical protein [Streptomyces xanthochromogenes]
MFLRGRSLTFWAVLLILLYLVATSPHELASFVLDSIHATIGFLRSVREVFLDLRT